MAYRSDREIVQDLVPIMLFYSVVWYGHQDKDGADGKQLLAWLKEAEKQVVTSVVPKKLGGIMRRALRVHEEVIAPFVEARAAVAKYGLVVFYVLDRLRQNGLFQVVDGSAFDQAISALLHEDGTLVEFANISKIDASAQKQARKVLAVLQANGLFAGAVWE